MSNRKQLPVKSAHRGNGNTFQLDVYSLFKQNPSTLLYRKPAATTAPKKKRGRPCKDRSAEFLSPMERKWCKDIRLPAEKYLDIKGTLLVARDQGRVFKKTQAQQWCRVDVNKTGKIYDLFTQAGWLSPA